MTVTAPDEALAVRLLGANLSAAAGFAPALSRFVDLVLAANDQVNLVSRVSASREELIERHLLDSLFGLQFLPEAAKRPLRLLDIGSGGGFPALPILIVRRDIEGTLMESTGKKCRILEEAIRTLDLTARVVNARFPAPQMAGHPRFDLLTSRAVADAGALVRDARPLLAPGARALLWTTEPLLSKIRKGKGIQSLRFHRSPGAQLRGIAVLECST